MGDTANLLTVARQGREYWLAQRPHTLSAAFFNSNQQGLASSHLSALLQAWNQAYTSDRSLYEFFEKTAHPFLRTLSEEQLEMLLSESLTTGNLIEHAAILSQWPTRHHLTKALRTNLAELARAANAPPLANNSEQEPLFKIIDFLGICDFQPENFRDFLNQLEHSTLLHLFTNVQKLKHFANYQYRLASALPMSSLTVTQAFAESLIIEGEGRHSVIIENCFLPIKEPRYPEPLYPSTADVDRWIFCVAGLCETNNAELAKLLRSFQRCQRQHVPDIQELFYQYLRKIPSNHEDVFELLSFSSDFKSQRIGSFVPYPQHPSIVIGMSRSMRQGSIHHKSTKGDFRASEPIDFDRKAVLTKLSTKEALDLITNQLDIEFAAHYIQQIFYSGNPQIDRILSQLVENSSWVARIEATTGTRAVVVIDILDRISLQNKGIKKMCLRLLSFAASTIEPQYLQRLLNELFLRDFNDEVDEIRQEQRNAICVISEITVRKFQSSNSIAEAIKWLDIHEELSPTIAPTCELLKSISNTKKAWISALDSCDAPSVIDFLHGLCLLLSSNSIVKLSFLMQLLSNLSIADLQVAYLCNAYFDPEESNSWLDGQLRIQLKIVLWRMIYSLDSARAISLLTSNFKADVVLFIISGIRKPDNWYPIEKNISLMWLDIVRENTPSLVSFYLGSLLRNANSDLHSGSSIPLLRLAGEFVKWYCDRHNNIQVVPFYSILEQRIAELEASDYHAAIEFAFVQLSDDEDYQNYINIAVQAVYSRIKDLPTRPHEINHLMQHLNLNSPGVAGKLMVTNG